MNCNNTNFYEKQIPKELPSRYIRSQPIDIPERIEIKNTKHTGEQLQNKFKMVYNLNLNSKAPFSSCNR